MVYISKVYTRSGDQGETRLADGTALPKDDDRIAAYGDVDELNSQVGVVRLELSRDPEGVSEGPGREARDQTLGRVQQERFNVGGEVFTRGGGTERVERGLIVPQLAWSALVASHYLPGLGIAKFNPGGVPIYLGAK